MFVNYTKPSMDFDKHLGHGMWNLVPLSFNMVSKTQLPTHRYLSMIKKKGVKKYFLVYVDDLVLTGNSRQEMRKFVEQLSIRFSLKDLGQLNFFLGVEAIHTKWITSI